MTTGQITYYKPGQITNSRHEIAVLLAENFEVEEDKVRVDVERTIDQLASLRIIR